MIGTGARMLLPSPSTWKLMLNLSWTGTRIWFSCQLFASSRPRRALQTVSQSGTSVSKEKININGRSKWRKNGSSTTWLTLIGSWRATMWRSIWGGSIWVRLVHTTQIKSRWLLSTFQQSTRAVQNASSFQDQSAVKWITDLALQN